MTEKSVIKESFKIKSGQNQRKSSQNNSRNKANNVIRNHKQKNIINNYNNYINSGYVGSHYPSYSIGYNFGGYRGWPYYNFYPNYYIPAYHIVSYNADGSILDLDYEEYYKNMLILNNILKK